MTDLPPSIETDMVEFVEAEQSPFLPGTHIQFAWDSTSLELIKRCPRLYQYTMIDGWKSKNDNIHLRFGIEVHQSFHDYENCKAEGIPHDDAVRDTLRALLYRIKDWEPDPNFEKKSEAVKTKPALLRTVLWYLDKFEDDIAKTVMLENGKAALEVSFKFELDFGPDVENHPPYLLCGHLDRIVDYQGSLFVMDRKTTTTTPGSYYFDQFKPHNQMTLYTFAAQVILESPIKGVIIDAIQIGAEFTGFQRGFTYRTPDQLDEWILDLEYWLRLAEDYAEADYWPMNDTACDKYGGCKFRDVCSSAPSVRENFLKADFVKGELWNPLRVRG